MADSKTPSYVWIIVAGIVGFAAGFGAATQMWKSGSDKLVQQAQALAQPDLPVKVGYRQSLLGQGLVAQFQNFGPNQLALRVTAKSAATNQQREWRIVLAPNQTQELGQREGWAFATGDELELFQDGYRPMKVKL